MMRLSVFRGWCLLLALGVCSGAAQGEQTRPLWEAGVGLSGLSFPAYRGAKEQSNYLLPFPYVIYRGERVQVDRYGLRGTLFDSDRWEIKASGNAGTPVNSDDVDARNGMPDLDPVVEFGPSINWIVKGSRIEPLIRLQFPVRAVATVSEDGMGHQGWVFHPRMNFNAFNWVENWNFGADIGPVFADRRYHEYYYGVGDAYATADRPAYEAEAGYSGISGLISATRRKGNVWWSMFLRWDYLDGAVIDDSPLVTNDNAVLAGFAIGWSFAESGQQVSVGRER